MSTALLHQQLVTRQRELARLRARRRYWAAQGLSPRTFHTQICRCLGDLRAIRICLRAAQRVEQQVAASVSREVLGLVYTQQWGWL